MATVPDTVARNRTQAQRRQRKARKRQERRLRTQRGPTPWRRDSIATIDRQASLRQLAALFDESAEPCSKEVAEGVADEAAELSDQLDTLAVETRDALTEWPDTSETEILRALLYDTLVAAAQDSVRWADLAQRWQPLAQSPDQVHLVNGKPVPTQHADDDDGEDTDDGDDDDGDIPY
jgi:hypothetical protein